MLRPTAIHRQRNTCDVGGRARGEKRNSGCKFLRLTKPWYRILCRPVLLDFCDRLAGSFRSRRPQIRQPIRFRVTRSEERREGKSVDLGGGRVRTEKSRANRGVLRGGQYYT